MAISIYYMGDRGVWHTKIRITLGPTIIHTLWTTPSPTFIPSECLTQMPLLQLVTDDAKYWEQCGKSVSVFEDWVFIGASDTYYDTK